MKHTFGWKDWRKLLAGELFMIDPKEFGRVTGFFIHQLQIFLLVFKQYSKDRIQMKASALTYYCIFALVPLLTVFMIIGRGFGNESYIENALAQSLKGQEEVFNWLLNISRTYLYTSSNGVIAGTGIAMLLWSIIKVFVNIEDAFNEIWDVKQNRHLVRRFGDYIAFIVIVPIFIIMAGSTNLVLTTYLNSIFGPGGIGEYISPVIQILIRLTPYLLLCIAFTILYITLPNTKVNFRPGLIAGIIAGIMVSFVQWMYFEFQSGVIRYNAVYGSFAALPLFLVWIQTSWLIILLGAEIAFANQNIHKYELETITNIIDHRTRRIVGLLLMKNITGNFIDGGKPLTAENMAKDLELPVRVVRQLLRDLMQGGVLSELYTNDDRTIAYHPAIDVRKITVGSILGILDGIGNNQLLISPASALAKIHKFYGNFEKQIAETAGSKLIEEL